MVLMAGELGLHLQEPEAVFHSSREWQLQKNELPKALLEEGSLEVCKRTNILHCSSQKSLQLMLALWLSRSLLSGEDVCLYSMSQIFSVL